MELSQRDRLSLLVEELTTSGQPQLCADKMKEIKKICRVSESCVEHVFQQLMSQLNQEHAEIRLSAFQMVTELFPRSHRFRTLLVDNFQEFLELTVETDSEQPLPPPREVARKLRMLSIQTVQAWQASYGSAYKKLALGFHFLKQVKKVDFEDAEARTVAERRREEERQGRLQRIYSQRVEAASKDMEESMEEIQALLVELESCMKLLVSECELPALSSAAEEQEPCCSKQLPPLRTRSSKEDGEATKTEEEDQEEQSDDDDHDDEEEEEEEEASPAEKPADPDFIRDCGLISHTYSLDLDLSAGVCVKETEDNEAVVSTVLELHRVLSSKHLPAVKAWVQVFTKSGAEQQLLRRAVDLKRSVEAALKKHNELHIDYKTRIRKVIKASSEGKDDGSDDEDDGDDDFEEVPDKEGYEPHIPQHLRAEYGLEPSPSTSGAPSKSSAKVAAAPPLPPHCKRLRRLMEDEEEDPTCAAATLRLLKKKLPEAAASSSSTPSSSSSSSGPTADQKAADAPVVPFGLDLYYWGQEQPNAGKIIKSTSQHQFWVPAETEEEVENQELLAESRSRYISFPGSFTPVEHRCRAPLAQGGLCQRQDRLKCPFHGPIIPRDQEGRPCSQQDRLREQELRQSRLQEQPDWRDPELMRDIEAATGQDLGSGRKKKGKKKKYPNLSDLKQSTQTSRSRLHRKIFNKSAMRRVADVMMKADRRKHDKFSNQFNYALN